MTIFAVQLTWKEFDYRVVKFIEAESLEAAEAELKDIGDVEDPSERLVLALDDYIKQNMLVDILEEEEGEIVDHEMTADDYYYEETYREFKLMQQSN